MGEELGVGGVQVRVPSRRRIALTSGRCHQTRAAGACAPRFGGKSRVCSRFEQQYRILQSSRRSRGTSVASTGRITRIAMVTPHAYPAPASLTSRAAHAGASSHRRRRVPIARRKLATHGSPSGNGIARGRRRFEAVAHEHLDWSSIERTHAREESGLWLPGSRGWTPDGAASTSGRARSPRRSQRDDDADVRSRVEGRATRDAGRRRGAHSIHRRSHPARPRVHRPTLPPPQPLLPRAARREHPRRPRPVPLQSIVQIRHHLRPDQKRHLPDARSGAHHRRRVRRRALLAVHQQLPKSLPIRAHTPRRPRVAVQSAQDGVLGAARSAQDGRARL